MKETKVFKANRHKEGCKTELNSVEKYPRIFDVGKEGCWTGIYGGGQHPHGVVDPVKKKREYCCGDPVPSVLSEMNDGD
jgi:hypothetical protein